VSYQLEIIAQNITNAYGKTNPAQKKCMREQNIKLNAEIFFASISNYTSATRLVSTLSTN